MNTNESICCSFEQLRTIRLSEARHYKSQGFVAEAKNAEWRAKAYEKIIPIIREYPKQIESGKEARNIYGIGSRMADRIDELLTTGKLKELEVFNCESTQNDDRESTLKLFESIHQVGRKTAEKWYDKGYRKFADIPRENCTDAQWISIQLFDQLNERIPRNEIQEAETIFKNFLQPKGIFFQICGSYRRGLATSGDIDVLIIAQEGRDVLSEFLQCPIFTHTLAFGSKKFLGICKIREIHHRIDVEVVQPHEYPFAVTYFTGSYSFNIKMRDHCRYYGLRLNEKSLTDSNGKFIIVESEEQLFAVLGLKYLTPEERDKY